MKPCDVDLLSQYLDGSLMLPQRRELEGHLRVCAPCAQELAELQHVDDAVMTLATTPRPIPVRTEERIWKSVGRRKRLSPIASLNRMMPAAVGSSIAAMLVLLSVNLGVLYRNAPDTGSAVRARVTETALVKQSAALIKNRRSAAVLGSNVVPRPTFPQEQVRRIQADLN